MKFNDVYWKESFSHLRKEITAKGRIVTIKDVMRAGGYHSKSSAHNALWKWEKMGLVMKDGGQWRLAK